MVLLIGIGSLAVDLGMQRVVRRDMQALADVVALDLARQIDGRTQSQLAPVIDVSDPTSALSMSLARNAETLGTDLQVVADWGAWNGTTWDTAADPPTAVQVVASAKIGFAFAAGSGGATRTAYAAADTSACYRLGSYAAAVKSNNAELLAPLNDIFGANLTLLGYQGIANADISLAQLAADPHIGSADALLTGSVSYANLLQATIDVLNAENQTSNSAAISALGTLLSGAGSVPSIYVGHFLGVSPTDNAALETQMNVLDLVAGAVLLADGHHAVDVPNLQSGVAGLGNLTAVQLYIQQGLQQACGPVNSSQAHAYASQLSGTLAFPYINLPSLNVAGVGTLQTSPASGLLDVSLADAQGQLIGPPVPTAPNVHCGSGSTDPSAFSVAVSSGLAHLTLTSQVTATGSVSILGLGIVNLKIVVNLRVDNSHAAQTNTAALSLPPNDTIPVSTGSTVRLNAATATTTIDPSSTATVAGISVMNSNLLVPTLNAIQAALVSGHQSFLAKTITPLVKNINDLLTGPLASLLGLDVAGADVYAMSAACSVPALRG